MNRYAIYILLSLFIATGCEVEDEWALESEDTELLVVDGLMTNEKKPHEVVLNKTVTSLNAEPEYISGAMVTISDGDSVFLLNENQPGHYYTDSIRAVVGKTYVLEIAYNGAEYQAMASSTPVIPLEPVNNNIVPADSLRWTYQYREDEQPSMLELNYYWEETDSLNNVSDVHAREYFYTLSSVDINKEFAPNKEKIRFPAETMIVRRKYALNADHEAFIRSLLAETDWRGSVFDELQGNVKTNLSEGAVGYFAVTTVDTDTVRVKEIVE